MAPWALTVQSKSSQAATISLAASLSLSPALSSKITYMDTSPAPPIMPIIPAPLPPLVMAPTVSTQGRGRIRSIMASAMSVRSWKLGSSSSSPGRVKLTVTWLPLMEGMNRKPLDRASPTLDTSSTRDRIRQTHLCRREAPAAFS